MSELWPGIPLPWEPPVTAQAIGADDREVGTPAGFDPASGGAVVARLRDLPDGYVKRVVLQDATGREIGFRSVGRVLCEGDEISVTMRPEDLLGPANFLSY